MGAALSAAKWYSLVALDGVRLGEFTLGLDSEEEARWACYLALEMHTGMERAAADGKNTCFSGQQGLPKFEELSWARLTDPQSWIDSYFNKPVWRAEPQSVIRLPRGVAAGS